MGWAKRNPGPDPSAPPDPSDTDSRFDEATGPDVSSTPATAAELNAMAMAEALAKFDKSPGGHALFKALPYIIPGVFIMSVGSWVAFMYFTYKKSKHYYG